MSLAICANLITAQESQSMKENLNVWLLFLKDYNGTTVMLDQFWSSNSDLELFTRDITLGDLDDFLFIMVTTA
jgi:hypothetical protein